MRQLDLRIIGVDRTGLEEILEETGFPTTICILSMNQNSPVVLSYLSS